MENPTEKKPVIYKVSEEKINKVRKSIAEQSFPAAMHQHLQGLIDFLIKE